VKIVKPSFTILDVEDEAAGVRMLRRIEYIARISHRSEDAQEEDSYDRFLRSVVMGHGDMSVIEHEKVTVEFEVDRGITHELVRHRHGAYTQESTRFVNYGKQPMRFVAPPFVNKAHESIFEHYIAETEKLYLDLLGEGVAPQIARSVLPNALASKIAVTYNLRAWRHVLIMRTSREALPQMKEVTVPLLSEFQRLIPILFEDIQPEMKQSEAMRLLR
jgi:thymidylate synthase (FAD)